MVIYGSFSKQNQYYCTKQIFQNNIILTTNKEFEFFYRNGETMTNQDTDIKFVDNWSKEDIVALYKSAGWWKESYDPSAITQLITGSFAFAVAVNPSSGKAIGMGRIISDGVSDAYIQDLVVLPEYRRQGIGKQLVNALLDRCLSKGMTWIGLISEPGQDGFYSSLGFKTMNNHIPMIYQIEEKNALK